MPLATIASDKRMSRNEPQREKELHLDVNHQVADFALGSTFPTMTNAYFREHETNAVEQKWISYVFMYIHVYREKCVYMYVYIYIYICVLVA